MYTSGIISATMTGIKAIIFLSILRKSDAFYRVFVNMIINHIANAAGRKKIYCSTAMMKFLFIYTCHKKQDDKVKYVDIHTETVPLGPLPL